MKKLLLFAAIAALSVITAGCDMYGLVKKVTVKYTTADYVNQIPVTRTVTGVATETTNCYFAVKMEGTDGHMSLMTDNANNLFVDSNSAGLWMAPFFMSGSDIIDPKETLNFGGNNGSYKFVSNIFMVGYVRVSGNVTYDNSTGLWSGDGELIVFHAGADIKGSNKWSDTMFKGVATIKLIPGMAAKMPVTSGELGSAVPVQATITIPAIRITGYIPDPPIL